MKRFFKFRFEGILFVVVLAALGYYIKCQVLRLDLIKTRHLFFFDQPYQSPAEELAEKERITQDLLRRSRAGEAIGWEGRSKNGRHEYKNGAMYWYGVIYTVVMLPKGNVTIGLSVKGAVANGQNSVMIVMLDDKNLGEFFVNDPKWKEYTLPVNSEGGSKILRIKFKNKTREPKTEENKKLFLGKVTISPVVLHNEEALK